MSKERNISLAHLQAILTDENVYSGTTFIGFDLATIPVLKGGKKNPMQGRVRKIAKGQVAMVFSNKWSSAYENMVNRRLAQAGKPADFKAGELPWGERIPNTSAIRHKGELYLQMVHAQSPVSLLNYIEQDLGITLEGSDREKFEALKTQVVAYESRGGEVEFELDGKPIERSAIEGIDTDKSEGEQGGLSDQMKVVIRSPKMSGILRLTMNGETYRVVPPTTN